MKSVAICLLRGVSPSGPGVACTVRNFDVPVGFFCSCLFEYGTHIYGVCPSFIFCLFVNLIFSSSVFDIAFVQASNYSTLSNEPIVVEGIFLVWREEDVVCIHRSAVVSCTQTVVHLLELGFVMVHIISKLTIIHN